MSMYTMGYNSIECTISRQSKIEKAQRKEVVKVLRYA